MAGGIILADLGWLEPESALALALVALLAGLVARRKGRLRAVAALLLFAGVGAHCLGTRIEAARSARPRHAVDVTVEGTLCAYGCGASWVVVELCQLVRVPGVGVDAAGAEPVPSRVRVLERRGTASAEWLASLRAGQRVRVRLRLQPPRSWGNPGSRDRVSALDRAGVGALASVAAPGLGVRLPHRDSWRPDGRSQGLRSHIGEVLASAGPGGGLLRALALGDRSALSPAQREAFARLGIAHLLAVSGLHLGLAAGLAYGLLRVLLVRMGAVVECGDARLWALAGALTVALVYSVLSGWAVPVRRATVFLLALGLGLVLGRRRSGAHLLAAAAVVVLAFDPGALFDLGAQLSFVASAALLGSLQDPHRSGSSSWLQGAVSSLIRSSASAVAVTAPVMACHAGPVTPVGLAANLAAVPWTAVVLLPAALTSAAATLLPANPVSDLILAVSEWSGRLTLTVLELAASVLPVAVGGARPAVWVLVVVSLLALAAVCSRRTRWRVLLALVTVLLLRWGPVAFIPPAPPRLVGLDVGQGDAVLIQGRRGALLVDGGRAIPGGVDLGRRVVLPALRALDIRRLDLVVASHADLDHWGGLAAVLAAIPVGELWIPVGVRSQGDLEALLEVARDRGVRVRERAAGDETVRFGDLHITPLWPPAKAPAGASRNDRSLVLRVELEGVRALLTGDVGAGVEEQLLASGVDLEAEILKLGHHGSRGSSSPSLLAAVGAEVALLLAPCPRRGGLPSGEVVQRVRRAGQALWWTGRDGAVFVALGRKRVPLAVWGWEPVRRCDAPAVWEGVP
jgi:competence protein ComEC